MNKLFNAVSGFVSLVVVITTTILTIIADIFIIMIGIIGGLAACLIKLAEKLKKKS